MPNKISADGKDFIPKTGDLGDLKPADVSIADDRNDVCGFGQPISARLAKKMFKNYYADYKTIYDDLVMGIDSFKSVADLKKSAGYNALKSFLDPKVQIISGVFGKEILLQILAQKNCEGIRYVIGKTPKTGKMTVVLLGVEELNGTEPDDDGTQIRRSDLVRGTGGSFDMDTVTDNTEFLSSDPLIAEVHKGSKSVGQFVKLTGSDDIQAITNKVFGAY